ncbi:MAG: rhodanese-like domain-containing protein [Anaerolineae bacterium]|nr:rhodanese-like domain-containing protein [Anaerolineae bacterium]
MGLYRRLFGGGVASISPAEAQRRLEGETGAILVDVRQPLETQSGTAPGAVLIPLTEFGRRLAELPRDRPILTICRSGHRSPIAARQLRAAGYDVTDVDGGMLAWERAGLPLTPPEPEP